MSLSWFADKIEPWPTARLVPYARNARTHSDAQIAQIAASSLHKLYGDGIAGTIEKVMGGEDFAFLCENTPGALAFVGIGNKEKLTDYPLHSDKFNIDEDVLPIGAALHAQFALDFLQETS